MNLRKQVGPAVSLRRATQTAKGPTYAQKIAGRLTEAQSQPDAHAWTAEEELIIATIQQTESVPRAEAIRCMQRRKKASRPVAESPAVPTTQRLCRNPRCRRGEDGGPGSLAHLRADALYCNATCKKAGQRSLNAKIGLRIASIHAGLKGTNSVLCGHPTAPVNMSLKRPAIAISRLGNGDSRSSEDVNEQSPDGTELHR
jgi:hypothetical protein